MFPLGAGHSGSKRSDLNKLCQGPLDDAQYKYVSRGLCSFIQEELQRVSRNKFT